MRLHTSPHCKLNLGLHQHPVFQMLVMVAALAGPLLPGMTIGNLRAVMRRPERCLSPSKVH
jgi:hypothetical protein